MDILTRKELEVFLNAVAAGKTVVGISESVAAVHLHPLYHETDVVRSAVLVEV